MRSDMSPVAKKVERLRLGKEIQQQIRAKLVEDRTRKMGLVLSEFRDLQRLAKPNTFASEDGRNDTEYLLRQSVPVPMVAPYKRCKMYGFARESQNLHQKMTPMRRRTF